jgi:hypothetical protein
LHDLNASVGEIRLRCQLFVVKTVQSIYLSTYEGVELHQIASGCWLKDFLLDFSQELAETL